VTALGIALAGLIGIALGLLGGGGSILTVPVLVYVLGYEAKPAIAMSLIIVGTAALGGAVRHWQHGTLRVRTALIFGACAMLGAYLGARLSVLLSGAVQLLLLATAMLAAAVSMYRRAGAAEVAPAPAPAAPRFVAIEAIGFGVGVLTGLAGVGGGFLIVPALVVFGAVPMRQAVGTSLLVIAMNCAAAFAGYSAHVPIPWGFVALFTLVAVAGSVAGTALGKHVPATALQRGFAVVLVLMGLFVLYSNRAAF
jgi:uncharacterized protein